MKCGPHRNVQHLLLGRGGGGIFCEVAARLLARLRLFAVGVVVVALLLILLFGGRLIEREAHWHVARTGISLRSIPGTFQIFDIIPVSGQFCGNFGQMRMEIELFGTNVWEVLCFRRLSGVQIAA